MGHPVEFIRNFAAKTFFVVIRALKPITLNKHVSKLFRSISPILGDFRKKKELTFENLIDEGSEWLESSRLKDLLSGVSRLFFFSCKGVKGCLHSKGISKLNLLLSLLLPFDENKLCDFSSSLDKLGRHQEILLSIKEDAVSRAFTVGFILRDCVDQLVHHTIDRHILPLWNFLFAALDKLEFLHRLSVALEGSFPLVTQCLLLASSSTIAMLLATLGPSNHRKHLEPSAHPDECKHLVKSVFSYGRILFSLPLSSTFYPLQSSVQRLVCRIWILYPSLPSVLVRVPSLLPLILQTSAPDPLVIRVCQNLFDELPIEIVQDHLVPHAFSALRSLMTSQTPEKWLPVLLQTIRTLDNRGSCDSPIFAVDTTMHLVSALTSCEDELDCIAEAIIAHIVQQLASYVSSSTSIHLFKATSALVWLLDAQSSVVTRTAPQLHILFDALTAIITKECLNEATNSFHLPTLSGLVHLFSAIMQHLPYASARNKVLETIVHSVVALFLVHPQSVSLTWALRGLVETLHKLGKPLNGVDDCFPLLSILTIQEQTELLSAIADCLSTRSHWLRVNLLTLAASFPPPILETRGAHDEAVPYDVISNLFRACTMEISLESGREFARMISNIEVIVRSGRLPPLYLRIVSSACLGMLNIKFQPFWEPLLLTIVAATRARSDDHLLQLILNGIDAAGQFTDQYNDPTAPAEFCDHLGAFDNGHINYPQHLLHSAVFYFAVWKPQEGVVAHEARTDLDTLFSNTLSVLNRCPELTLRKSKLIVPMFLRFVREQYYKVLTDEPEVADLLYLRILSPSESSALSFPCSLPPKSLRTRLEAYLSVFAAVPSPKQLYMHAMLYQLYISLLAKADAKVSSLALECLMAYKPSFVMQLKDSIYRIADDKTLRDELVNLNITPKNPMIPAQHHGEVVSFLSYLLYSKFSMRAGGSKANRDSGIARRNAVLGFLCQVEGDQLSTFIHLILRGILPNQVSQSIALKMKAPELDNGGACRHEEWWAAMRDSVLYLSPDSLAGDAIERQLAFLHFVEHIVRVLGHRLDPYVDVFVRIIILILSRAQLGKPYDGIGSETSMDKTQISKVRSLCIIRISEFVELYYESYDFISIADMFLQPLLSLVNALPSAVSSSSKPPSLLKLFYIIASNAETVHILSSRGYCLEALINCLAMKAEYATALMVSDILLTLLSTEEGSCMYPYVGLVIDSFCRRFIGGGVSQLQSYKLSELAISSSVSIKQEMQLLLKFSNFLLLHPTLNISSIFVLNLATLLLGMLRTYITSRKIKIEEEWVLNILGSFQALMPRLEDICHFVPFISRLFGPALHSQSLLNNKIVRAKLVEIYSEIGFHSSAPPNIVVSLKAITNLTALDKKVIGGRDFLKCIPVLQSLAGEANGHASWSAILGPAACSDPRNASLYQAVLHECLRSMFDEEVLIRGAVLAALKHLVDDSKGWSQDDAKWLDAVTTVLMPAIHKGLKQGSDATRKGFISLLAHVVKVFSQDCPTAADFPQLHGDLHVLLNADPEQDFFENIVHIQQHRRVRALAKVLLSKNHLLLDSCNFFNLHFHLWFSCAESLHRVVRPFPCLPT